MNRPGALEHPTTKESRLCSYSRGSKIPWRRDHRFPFTRIALEAASSASQTWKSAICTNAGSSTFLSRARFVTRCLPKALPVEHRWVPNSGWTTFLVRSDKDLQHAVWLMRLSYFRYALKTATDPYELFAEASRELQLTAPFNSLLEQFVPVAKI